MDLLTLIMVIYLTEVTNMADTTFFDSKRQLGKDFFVSNDTRATLLNNNDLVVGATGAGKTRSYVTALLDNISENMIVVDTKGMLYRKYKADLKKKGFDIYRLNLIDGKQSIKYNPLDFVAYNEATKTYNSEDIASLAHTLCPDDMDRFELYWVDAARLMIQAMIAFVLEALPKKEHHIGSVITLFRNWNYQDYDKLFQEHRLKYPDSYACIQYDLARNVSESNKTDSCIRSFVANALACFTANEAIDTFTGRSDISFADFSDKKMVLFIDISDNDRSRDRIASIFYTQLFQSLIRVADSNNNGQLGIPLRIIMDDFASNVKVPDLDGKINVIRSRGICMSIIIQSLKQLASIYGADAADNIQNACDHIIYLGSRHDNEYFARLANMDIYELIDKLNLHNLLICERGRSTGIIVPKYNF